MDFNSRPNSVDSFQPNNHFYHHSSPQQNNVTPQQPTPTAVPTTGQGTAQPMPQSMDGSAFAFNQQMIPQMNANSEYLNNYQQYVQQYYREYYRQWLQQHNRHHLSSLSSQTSAPTLRQPLKYGSHRCHARAVFSQHNNSVIIVDNTSTTGRHVLLYSLNDLFVDYLFEKQLFHLLLRNGFQLPFESRETTLQWIRCKQQSFELNFELKLILKVIQMILKQNSRITGQDLSELLFDLVDCQQLNEYSRDNNALNTYRVLLMRGQLTLALNHALSTQLMDHSLTLSYLIEKKDSIIDELMFKTIRKFCETMNPNDPVVVFYLSLLNRIQRKNTFLELTFESFLILLSNEMSLSSVVVKSDEFKHLLSFVKNLMNNQKEEEKQDFLLSDELFDSEMDSILVNECLEFSLNSGKRFNRRLVEKKTKLVSILFDFGFHSNALKYCQQLKAFCDQSSTTARLVSQIESRFDQNISLSEETTVTTLIDDNNLWQTSDTQLYDDDNTHETTEEDIQTTTPETSSPLKQSIPQQLNEVQESAPHPPLPFSVPPISAINSLSMSSQSPIAPPMGHMISAPTIAMNSEPIVSPINSPLNNFESIGGEMGFSFVSNSQSLPSMPFNEEELKEDDNNRQQQKTTAVDDSRMQSSNTIAESKSTKGTNSGFLSKLLNFKGKNQAILPDDSKMTLIFDKNTNQWIDTSAQLNGSAGGGGGPAPPPRAPPVMPPSIGGQVGGAKKFEFRSQRRYVDITRKN